MNNRLEQIIKLKLNNFKIEIPKKKESYIEPNPCGEPGYVAYGTKIKDGVEVPNCIPDPEEMKKIIKKGFSISSPEKRLQMIRDIKLDLNKNVFEKQEFVIPNPKGGEDEQTYIGRCISAIVDEYDQEGQAYAVCKSTWDSK